MSLACVPTLADARPRKFTFFPKDLDMEEPSDLEANWRAGPERRGGASSLVVADLELDYGLARNFEAGLDGQFASDAGQGLTAHDQMWLSGKHLIADRRGKTSAVAFGVQHGPRMAVMAQTSGFGYQALALLVARTPRNMLQLAMGGFVDPRDEAAGARPVGAVATVGADVAIGEDWVLSPSLSAGWTRGSAGEYIGEVELDYGGVDWITLGVAAHGGTAAEGRVVGASLLVAPLFHFGGKATGK